MIVFFQKTVGKSLYNYCCAELLSYLAVQYEVLKRSDIFSGAILLVPPPFPGQSCRKVSRGLAARGFYIFLTPGAWQIADNLLLLGPFLPNPFSRPLFPVFVARGLANLRFSEIFPFCPNFERLVLDDHPTKTFFFKKK